VHTAGPRSGADSSKGRPIEEPARIVLGVHPALGLLAVTPDEQPGTEQKLLRMAGFTAEPGEDLYTLADDQASDQDIRQAVTGLLTAARTAGIPVAIDPVFAAGLDPDDETPDPLPAQQPGPSPQAPSPATAPASSLQRAGTSSPRPAR
jgi:hypothetical protein